MTSRSFLDPFPASAGGFTQLEISLRTPPGPDRAGHYRGDPVWAVVARRLSP